MTGSVSFPELWLCDFPFTSGTGAKRRPSLVLFDLGNDALIARVTSVLHTEPFDYAVQDWQSAKLLKPSTVRIKRVVTVEKSLLIRKLGELSPVDAEAVRAIWNTQLRL